MRRLLIINPNTSQSVTQLLQVHGQQAGGSEVQIQTQTARFGAAYIACEASYAVAGHAVLDAWATAKANPDRAFDAVLIGCFGDPGLMALRENCDVPVTGLAEAAFFQAAQFGRFAVVTGGARWKPILTRLAHSLGFSEQLAGIHTVAPSGAQLAQDPQRAQNLLQAACLQAIAQFDVQALVLGGAGLAGMAARLQPALPVPLVDSVTAGVRHAFSPCLPESLGRGRFELAWHRLSAEMTVLGALDC